MEYINKLYEAYPVLAQIDEENKGILGEKAIFKDLFADEYLSTNEGECIGFLFVISGSIKINKLNERGEETNLYNIERGQLCHEALSCFMNCKSLNIIGKAIQDSKICVIPFDVVNKYLLQDTLFLQYIYKDLYDKLKIIINVKEEVRHESLTNRLVKLLIDKKSRNIYITHNELAFELDSAREVVSRKLKELEKRGYLKLSRGKIQIEKDLNEVLK
ncbi:MULTISPECIES: Crp/Fnr family transcriptional regulator [unclassified Clostridium]|uniref:Crp/Fnr family transcriptional regulator n=1 Tax=Clostridium TaxID=1485 RepID=UPI001C8C660C|nr:MULTISPECIES: Crp/Fnr family transcriptional regulator [unclassified Clostridium]MBX9139218.1 Crp/Fnr family transcriptional regulator [Clostridium sp. K12(2020)]MBX9145973.1 Crp/Fnr family transcriptional regulator [Clostridium sp. K13]MDU2290036.1 Crp/Fnr family transcriptional regulator [Clostridium celatum]